MWASAPFYQWAARPAGAAAFGEVHTVPLPAGERPSVRAPDVGCRGARGAHPHPADEGTPPNTHMHFRVRTLTRAASGALQVGPVLDEGTDDCATSYSSASSTWTWTRPEAFYGTWSRGVSHTTAPTGVDQRGQGGDRPPGAARFGTAEDVATARVRLGELPPRTSGRARRPPAWTPRARSGSRTSDRREPERLRLRGPAAIAAAGGRLRARHAASRPGRRPSSSLQRPARSTWTSTSARAVARVAVWARGGTVQPPSRRASRPPAGPCGTKQPLASGDVFAPVAAMGAAGRPWSAGGGSWRGAEASFARGRHVRAPARLGPASRCWSRPEATAVDPMGDAVVADRPVERRGQDHQGVRERLGAPAVAGLSVSPTVGDPRESLAFGATSPTSGARSARPGTSATAPPRPAPAPATPTRAGAPSTPC